MNNEMRRLVDEREVHYEDCDFISGGECDCYATVYICRLRTLTERLAEGLRDSLLPGSKRRKGHSYEEIKALVAAYDAAKGVK